MFVTQMAKGSEPDTDAGGDNLTHPLHTRVSAQADALLRERARGEGIKPATWARLAIYRALGLLKNGAKR